MIKLTLAEMDKIGKETDFFQRYDYNCCSDHSFVLTGIWKKWEGEIHNPNIPYTKPVIGDSAQEVLDKLLNKINSGELEEFTKDLNMIKSID